MSYAVNDISDCPLAPNMGAALEGVEEFCRVRISDGGYAIYERPLLWPGPSVQDAPYHRPGTAAHVLPSDVTVARDCYIGGRGTHLRKNGAYIYTNSSYPAYCEQYISKNIDHTRWGFDGVDVKKIEKPVFVVDHFNSIYGHFLIEILPKLLFMKSKKWDGVVIVSSATPRHVRAAIKIILPDLNIVEYDHENECINAKLVILPPMLNSYHIFDPIFINQSREFAQEYGVSSAANCSAIFISRKNIRNKFRDLSNAEDLENAAVMLGMKIVHPEEMSWAEQIGMFRSAGIVVGEFGSGMHNSIFSGVGAKTVLFNIINNVQSRIGNAFSQDIGYLLDKDGKPRRFTPGWTDQQSYSIDVDDFCRKMESLLASVHCR